MLDEQMLRRLAFVRYIHGLAVDQSRQPEPQRAAALLTFHDAVEFWLRLASEKLGAPLDTPFMGHWKSFASLVPPILLAQEGPMSRLNNARADLKHRLTLPSTLDLESYRATTTAFFEEYTPHVFGVDFGSISLVDMVQCETARTLLREAQEALGHDEREKALEKTALAFSDLLRDYEVRAGDGFDSPFRFADRVGPAWVFSPRFQDHNMREFVSLAYRFFRDISRALPRLSEALRILALGIDYRRYVRFQRLTPHVGLTLGGNVLHPWQWEELPSLRECNACIDFVVDCAIHLQQLDLDTSQAEGLGKKRRSLDPPPSGPPDIRMTRGGSLGDLPSPPGLGKS